MQDCEFEIFIVTGESVDKVLPTTRELAKSGFRAFRTHVLSGAPGPAGGTGLDASIRVSHFPGESVFHLRSRIPVLAGECGWVVILEDHNLIDRSWPQRVSTALNQCDQDVSMVVGAASNTRSTDKWSWANFLCVLGFHWAPEIQAPLTPLAFNIGLRRSVLGREQLALGQYESGLVPLAMESATPDPSFPVDHMQFRSFPEVFYYHWCNGRVTGAGMREYTVDGMKHVYRHAKVVSFRRQQQLRDIMRNHPLRNELPKGTGFRTQLLALAHSLGAVYGGLFGEGRAPWALE